MGYDGVFSWCVGFQVKMHSSGSCKDGIEKGGAAAVWGFFANFVELK